MKRKLLLLVTALLVVVFVAVLAYYYSYNEGGEDWYIGDWIYLCVDGLPEDYMYVNGIYRILPDGTQFECVYEGNGISDLVVYRGLLYFNQREWEKPSEFGLYQLSPMTGTKKRLGNSTYSFSDQWRPFYCWNGKLWYVYDSTYNIVNDSIKSIDLSTENYEEHKRIDGSGLSAFTSRSKKYPDRHYQIINNYDELYAECWETDPREGTDKLIWRREGKAESVLASYFGSVDKVFLLQQEDVENGKESPVLSLRVLDLRSGVELGHYKYYNMPIELRKGNYVDGKLYSYMSRPLTMTVLSNDEWKEYWNLENDLPENIDYYFMHSSGICAGKNGFAVMYSSECHYFVCVGNTQDGTWKVIEIEQPSVRGRHEGEKFPLCKRKRYYQGFLGL